jgi:cation diffusion facilitator CzcD-associated flavoprotein CzcO
VGRRHGRAARARGRLPQRRAIRRPRVVVVGSGNSGAEIAVDLAEGGSAHVLLSVRTPPSIVRRDTLGFPSQVLRIATARLPVPVVDRIAAGLRRVCFPDLTEHGLPAPSQPYSQFLERVAAVERAPGLYFIGYEVTLGDTFRLIGIQAKQLASAVAA